MIPGSTEPRRSPGHSRVWSKTKQSKNYLPRPLPGLTCHPVLAWGYEILGFRVPLESEPPDSGTHRKALPASFISAAAAAIIILQAQEDQGGEDHLWSNRQGCSGQEGGNHTQSAEPLLWSKESEHCAPTLPSLQLQGAAVCLAP